MKLLRQLIKEEIRQLSMNVINRLMGFLEEIDNVRGELMNAYGVGTIWKDRKDSTDKSLVKSQVDQLLHLGEEIKSITSFLNKQFNDKNLTQSLNKLVNTLDELSRATKGGMLG